MSEHWTIFRKGSNVPNYVALITEFPTPAEYNTPDGIFQLFVADRDGFDAIDEELPLVEIQALVAAIVDEPVKLTQHQGVLWKDAL